MNQARLAFARFPEVTRVVSQVGRPDDGTDATGFFNTEYFIDLKPHDQWRNKFHKDKELLIASLDEEVEKIPGVDWNFSQPISDNMEEAVSGVKGELSVKIIGDDLNVLENKADEVVSAMQPIPGIADLGIFRVLGQPNLNLIVDRAKADRYAINVADIQDAIETAVGGKAVSEVLIGEAHYDLVVRYQAPYRTTEDDIANIRILSPSGERVALGQLCDIKIEDGASMIFREENSRYIAIKYSVRGRDLGSTVRDAIRDVQQKVKLAPGYTLEWAGEYASQQRANKRLALIVPITVLLIVLLLYTAFGSSQLVAADHGDAGDRSHRRPAGAGSLATRHALQRLVGHRHVLALFGVSAQVGLIMIQWAYINQARRDEPDIPKAVVEGAVRSLRPTLMVMPVVATLGLLACAALSHDIGSDSQRPFAIVIVGGPYRRSDSERRSSADPVCADCPPRRQDRREVSGGDG